MLKEQLWFYLSLSHDCVYYSLHTILYCCYYQTRFFLNNLTFWTLKRPLDSHNWLTMWPTQGIHMWLWCLFATFLKWFYHEKSIRFHHGFSHQQIPRVFPAFSCGFPSIFPRFSHGFPPFDVRFIMFWHRFSRQTFRPHLLPRVVLRSPRCQRRSASRILQGTSMATAERLGIRRAPGPARKKGELWNFMGILMGILRTIQRENWCLMMS